MSLSSRRDPTVCRFGLSGARLGGEATRMKLPKTPLAQCGPPVDVAKLRPHSDPRRSVRPASANVGGNNDLICQIAAAADLRLPELFGLRAQFVGVRERASCGRRKN